MALQIFLWPARSPDPTPCHCYLWRSLKDKAYKKFTHTHNEPEEVTRLVLSAISTQQQYYMSGLVDFTNGFRLKLGTLQYKLHKNRLATFWRNKPCVSYKSLQYNLNWLSHWRWRLKVLLKRRNKIIIPHGITQNTITSMWYFHSY
jgi:hypothetical protein